MRRYIETYTVTEGRYDKPRKLMPILAELNAELRKLNLEAEGGFDPWPIYPQHKYWPDHKWMRWTAVYYVRGGSEGFYVHIDAVGDHEREGIALLKCWDADEAEEIVAVVSELLGV